MIWPLMVLLDVTALIFLPGLVTVIGAIGFSGIGASLMSLVVSGAVALGALFTPPPPPRVTYGVVRPHDIHHDHWHRSEQEINPSYRGWPPEFNGEQYHEIP